jgi:hypothetical protein
MSALWYEAATSIMEKQNWNEVIESIFSLVVCSRSCELVYGNGVVV